jgi:hypothetical protein
MAGHYPKSKLRLSTNDEVYFTSLSTRAISPYLKGEIYSIQDVQEAIFPAFLKKPENMMIGNKNIGRTVLTDLES